MARLKAENQIHHGVLFVQDEKGAVRLIIPLGDIFCVYYKGERDSQKDWRKGCFIQFYDREGVFYRDEDEPTKKEGKDLYYNGSIAIVEIELPNLSVRDVCRAMMTSKYDVSMSFNWAAYFTFNLDSMKKIGT